MRLTGCICEEDAACQYQHYSQGRRSPAHQTYDSHGSLCYHQTSPEIEICSHLNLSTSSSSSSSSSSHDIHVGYKPYRPHERPYQSQSNAISIVVSGLPHNSCYLRTTVKSRIQYARFSPKIKVR